MILLPSRFKVSCSISSIRIMRSPGTPPRGAALPLPLMLSCMPSLTPAGIFMLIVSSPRINPSPWQTGHLAVITVPSPLQVGQVVVVCIWPRMVLVTLRTAPAPPQVLQVCTDERSLAPEPSQVLQTICLFTFIFFSAPFAISSSVRRTFIRRLLPRIPLRPPLLCLPPPPKKSPNGLPPPNISPNWLNMSSIFMAPPPYPPPPPFGDCALAAWPNWL